jgi:hypothetical protein
MLKLALVCCHVGELLLSVLLNVVDVLPDGLLPNVVALVLHHVLHLHALVQLLPVALQLHLVQHLLDLKRLLRLLDPLTLLLNLSLRLLTLGLLLRLNVLPVLVLKGQLDSTVFFLDKLRVVSVRQDDQLLLLLLLLLKLP